MPVAISQDLASIISPHRARNGISGRGIIVDRNGVRLALASWLGVQKRVLVDRCDIMSIIKCVSESLFEAVEAG